jgi:hypothetical protein
MIRHPAPMGISAKNRRRPEREQFSSRSFELRFARSGREVVSALIDYHYTATMAYRIRAEISESRSAVAVLTTGRNRWDQGLTAAEMKPCHWPKPKFV